MSSILAFLLTTLPVISLHLLVTRPSWKKDGLVTGRRADVVAVANTVAEVALKLVRPGKKNKYVTAAIQKVVAAYDCKIVEGVLSHQLEQFVIDGNKVIPNVSNPDTRVDDAEFKENEVYAVDIVANTGEGKPKLLNEKSNDELYFGFKQRRANEQEYAELLHEFMSACTASVVLAGLLSASRLLGGTLADHRFLSWTGRGWADPFYPPYELFRSCDPAWMVLTLAPFDHTM